MLVEDTVRDDVDGTNPNETEACNDNDAATRATVEGYTIIIVCNRRDITVAAI